jgi:hypothetical protein
MRKELIEVIEFINTRVFGGDNALEIEDYYTLSCRCAKYGVKTDTKELGELYDLNLIK